MMTQQNVEASWKAVEKARKAERDAYRAWCDDDRSVEKWQAWQRAEEWVARCREMSDQAVSRYAYNR